MKVLVLGGSRYIGFEVVQLLLKAKHQVTVLNRGTLKPQYSGPVTHVKLDRNNSKAMKEFMNGKFFDTVLDLSIAEGKQASETIDIFRDKVGRYIFASSMFVYPYGQSINEEQFDAMTYNYKAVNLAKASNSETKKYIEAVLLQSAPFIAVAVRLPFVVGLGDPQGKLKKTIQKIILKEELYLPNMEARISVISPEDAARCFVHLVSSTKSNVFNCSPDMAISIGSMTKLIESLTYRDLRNVPEANAKTLCAFSIKSDFYIDGTKLRNTGFSIKPVAQWMPGLIEALIKEINAE